MSYLGRSRSAEREGQTVLGGGAGGAGGALSLPFSWRAGLVLLVGVGRDPVEECVACCTTPGRWGGKDIKIKILPEYRDYADIFSQEKINTLPEYSKYDHRICNDPMIGSYNHYHLSPNGIPSGNQGWYGLVYLVYT